MHRALVIEEILLNIFDSFSLSNYWRNDGKDIKGIYNLATLVRTRRAFKEPALDLLWEELVESSH